MKKKYIKPEILIENFEVNEFIAGACAGKNIISINTSIYGCAYNSPGGEILLSSYCTGQTDIAGEPGINVFEPTNPEYGSTTGVLCYHEITDVCFNS